MRYEIEVMKMLLGIIIELRRIRKAVESIGNAADVPSYIPRSEIEKHESGNPKK